MKSNYRLINHTSDLGIQVTGASLPELFINAARSIYAIALNEPYVGQTVQHTIQLTGVELDLLLKDWLTEILFLITAKHIIITEFSVAINADYRLDAELEGIVYQPDSQVVQREIKSITYHHLNVRKRHSGWMATFIMDV